ncbi:LytTr DNA-binding domain-containing protein [Tenacibaculum sp. MAR_2009_124]|uniref:LytR/AlgR family response regulator transcription factor n=1 Tax=Tenacibaculum sp. MAR_2009_124 TaxID=1250059 RepID=UPI0008959488|nr:LytTR family DNA-binding domain-containing protein [Tenacibaculum sp. MAR_2009_124]SEB36109.1 LytTr DNA-binding domain-containing protein [Tenacibaculum sp. MAR_2009_124]
MNKKIIGFSGYDKLKISLLSSIVIFFIIGTIQPFDIYNYSSFQIIYAGICCGVLSGIITYTSLSLMTFRNWTVKNELLLILCSYLIGIGFVLVFYFTFVYIHKTLEHDIELLLYNFYVVFCLTLWTYIILRSFQGWSFLGKKVFRKTQSTLKIRSNNTYNNIAVNSILFIEAYGNYSKIYLTDVNEKEYILLNCSLLSIENLILEGRVHNLVRIHKGYIINTQKIKSIQGNIKTSHLTLFNTNQAIPISRKKTPYIRELFYKQGSLK